MDLDVKSFFRDIKVGLQKSEDESDIKKWLTIAKFLVVDNETPTTSNLKDCDIDKNTLLWIRTNISEHHVKQIYELILAKVTIEWIKTLGPENVRLLMKPIFLEGNLTYSFMAIFQGIDQSSGKDFRFQRCVLLMEEFLTQPRLAKLLQSQISCKKIQMPQSIQDLDPEQQILVEFLTSLPDKMANKLCLDNSEKFLPQSYVPLLALSILDNLELAHGVLKQGENISLQFICVFIGKLSLSGHAHHLLETLVPYLCVRVRKDYMWCRICERVFSQLPARCMETIIVPLLRQIPWYGLVDKFLGDAVVHSPSMKVLLCTKIMLHRVLPKPKIILHNVIGYLASFHTRRHLLIEVCLNLLHVWGDASSMRHISAEQHVYISQALMVCIGHLNSTEKSANESELLRLLMPGVHAHLESSDPAIRMLGMVVAKTLTQEVAPTGPKLEFQLEVDNPDVADLLSYKNVPSDPGISRAEKSVLESEWKASDLDQSMKSVSIKDKDLNQAPALPEPDLDSDDDLEPYDMSNDQKMTKAKEPKFIRDCMEGLINSSDDADKTEICLSAAEALIRKKTDGLEEVSVEMAKILLHMQDTHSFNNFQLNRFNSLVALAVMCPSQVAEYLTKEFYERNYSIRQRMDMLEVLASAAQELSSVEKHLPSQWPASPMASRSGNNAQNTASDPAHWREVIQRRIESNTRRFAKGRTQPEPVATLNRFAPVAGTFFYPLMCRVDQSTPCLDLIGRDSLLLFRLLYTLSIVLNSSKNLQAATHMGRALLEFTWSLRYHQDSSIRQAVLVAITTVLLVVPAHALIADLHTDVMETKAWLEAVVEQDPNTECQKLAAQALCLFQDQIKKAVDSSSAAC